jgi:trk system potassium uptake protein TrkA
MHRTKGAYRMYMIVVGAGGVGTGVIALATAEKNEVVVIESDPERAREVSREYDVVVLDADATAGETLREAGAERADALIVTTSDDAVNLMVVSMAVEFHINSVVSVVNEKDHAAFFRRLGATVMQNPEEVVAAHLYNVARRPRVQDFVALPEESQLFRLELRGKSPLAGRTVAQCTDEGRIPETMRIVSVLRGGKKSLAEADTKLREGDLVTFFSLNGVPDGLFSKLIG